MRRTYVNDQGTILYFVRNPLSLLSAIEGCKVYRVKYTLFLYSINSRVVHIWRIDMLFTKKLQNLLFSAFYILAGWSSIYSVMGWWMASCSKHW